MPITIGSNIASLRSQRQLSKTSSELSTVYERLSSGMRINKASDDAAGLAISDSLRADAKVLAQGIRNLNDGISLLNIADGAIDNLSQVVIRLKELAEQAANGVYGATQRKAMDAEAQALSEEFFRISRTTEFNDINLFNGDLQKLNLQAGVGVNAILSGNLGGKLGTGSFNTAIDHQSGASPISITSGDFNGDGILDIVATNYSSATASVSLGHGDGSFASSISYQVGTNPFSISTSDFNGDGILDLVSASHSTSSVSVLLGEGDGTFGTYVSYFVGTGPISFANGDFNGDGNIDIVAANFHTSSASILLGRGDGTFGTRVSYATGLTPYSIISGDFNGDGLLDLATADQGSTSASILLGRGNGTFNTSVSYTVGANPFSIAGGDFNGDGYFDLVTADTSDTASILLGRGDGTFAARVSYDVGINPNSIVTGDFNGDGVLDLATAESGNSTSVLLGRGDGTFSSRISFASGSGARSIITGDFNTDGVLDLATANFSTSTISLLSAQTKDGISPLLTFSLKTMADAKQSMGIFQDKLNQLSEQRGKIGAFISRVNVASNVLQSTRENYIAAAHRISDADIASEAANLVRLQILRQASASVLAQANQQPAIALKLLK